MTKSGQWTANSSRRVCLLDEVGGDDQVRVVLDRWSTRTAPLSRLTVEGSSSSASMPNLVRSSACHCGASCGEHRTASRSASPVARSSATIRPGLDCLADPDAVGDQQPGGVLGGGHHQRHELVVPRGDGEFAKDRNGPPVARKDSRNASRSSRARVASPRSSTVGGGRRRRGSSMSGSSSGGFVVAAAQRSCEQQPVGAAGHDQPVASARVHQGCRAG